MTKTTVCDPRFVQLPRKPTEKQLAAVMKATGLPVQTVFAAYRAMIDACESERRKRREG